jgi:hypothetical protein
VALLADREIATVQAWLADHPGISVSRETEAAVTARLRRRHCRMRSRSPIALPTSSCKKCRRPERSHE